MMAHYPLHAKMADEKHSRENFAFSSFSTLDQRKIIWEYVAYNHRWHAEESFNASPQLYPGPKVCSIRGLPEHVMAMVLSIAIYGGQTIIIME